MRMILVIEKGGAVVVPLNPLLVRWSQHTIISVFLDDHLDGGLGVGGVGRTHPCLLLENAREPLAAQW